MSANIHTDVLTVSDVAHELRCSKAHVYNVIRGRIPGVGPLPVLSIGRRKLIRRSSLEAWKRANERAAGCPAMIHSSPDVDAADA